METIKEEKKADLEQLLNSLIEKGWKPRWEKVELYWTSKDTFWEKIVVFNGNAGWFKRWWCTYRELVSKESWLWQFVCENGMVVRKRQWTNRLWWEPEKCFDYTDYKYRLIESALCNEEDLEKFLLDNIKIEW